jgi:hypothetical protein
MLPKRLILFLIAGALAAAPACAAPVQTSTAKAAGKAGKKSAAKDNSRKIVSYSLFDGPLFKSNAAVIEQRPFGTASSLSGPAYAMPPAAPPRLALKPDAGNPADGAGVTFGCREKVLGAIPKMRELTACYRHNVDKSWQAQTYFSKGYAEGIQHWGGGLSVAYAY